MRRLAGSIAALIPVMGLALSPSDGGPLALLPVTINAASGDQYDPHVSGDLAAYTAGSTIRYYDFFSAGDVQVPSPPGAIDLLSDVGGGRIVFSRIEPSGRIPVMVYDTASSTTTEVDPVAAPVRFGSAIGSNTVAFIDQGLSPEGEVVAADLAGGAARITNDALTNQSPSVAPLGDLVVYESCGTSCDIHQAGRAGASWVITALTNTPEHEANPDTDGVIVVYDADRAGERDIRWQPVGGDAEAVLSLAGAQRNPSVSGGVIAFESIAVGDTAADLFVYHVATNRLFRVTSTPADESLNDVYLLPDGRVRVVWAMGEVGARDVFGATFELPPVEPPHCEDQTATLSASVSYHPRGWQDGSADVADLAFTVPASIPVSQGNAANGSLWLTFWQDGADPVKCLYKGDGQQHDGAGSPSAYLFHHCTLASVTAGSAVVADHVRVRLQNADESEPVTSVRLTIGTECPDELAARTGPELAGCSSSSGPFTFAALALALLAFLAPRRSLAQARARRL